MIPKEELDKAIEIAKKYKIGRMYLVGSALHKRVRMLMTMILQ